MSEDRAVSVTEHLEELRTRLVKSVISVLVAFIAGWIFRRDILAILKKPLIEALPEEIRHTILLKVVDKFFIDVKVAFIGALFLAAPYIVFQVWRFISPALYQHEKRLAFPMIFFGGLLFATGVLFGYFFVLPFGFSFLIEYSTTSGDTLFFHLLPNAVQAGDKLEIALKEHINFTATLLFVFGLAFETPLFMFAAGWTGAVEPKWFAKQRKYAIVAAFIFAAILTPPDPWTQSAFALPLLLLYELGIWSTRLFLLLKKNTKNP